MKWEKLGRIFEAKGQRPWIVSHSTQCTPEHMYDDLYRIYFAPRDDRGRSNISYLVIDLKEPQRVLELCETPCMEPGPIGAHDDDGAICSWLVHRDGRRWLYYVGWNNCVVTPWRVTIGLAYCDADAKAPVFVRHSIGPIFDRSVIDPYFVSNPCVLFDNGVWRMWYLSGLPWQPASPAPLPRYNLRCAESHDGINWQPTGHVCIPLHEGEAAIARPCVVRDGDLYRMWYCYRGDTFRYRVGYAESSDGLAWTRQDERAGLPHSPSGWDCEETGYPTVFDHKGTRYMLYCGNGYSRAGFGLATLVGT